MQIRYIGWHVPGFRRFLRVLQQYDISDEARYRLSVLQWHLTTGEENISRTARHFHLHRNTVGKWLQRFNPRNPRSLEPRPRVPVRTYRKTHPAEYVRKAVALKKEKPYYGKEKISRILRRDHGIAVSASWVGKVIRAHKLQYLWRTQESACRFKKTVKKRLSRTRPPSLNVPRKSGTWIQVDTVVLYWQGKRVYVLCAVDLASRFGIAYAYNTPSSKNAKDFLGKIRIFFTGAISLKMVQTDNGSEFLKHFDAACREMGIEHTFSKPKSPKMNAFVERFNETIQIECLRKDDAVAPLFWLNEKIQRWLLEYNAYRPHASLDYRTPLDEYIAQLRPASEEVHTMYVTHTTCCECLAYVYLFAILLMFPIPRMSRHATTIRLDPRLKKAVMKLAEEEGISFSVLVQMLLLSYTRRERKPEVVQYPKSYVKRLRREMKETDRLHREGKLKTYGSAKELFDDILGR